jgi:hypothetical protein
MKLTAVLVLAVAGSVAVHADFSYTSTMKGGGMMAAGVVRPTHTLIKGDKMKVDTGDHAMIMDFGSQTITHINHAQKTYSVTPFGEVAAKAGQAVGAQVNVDVQETGQRKVISGFNCRQVITTMEMDSPQAGQQGGAMKMRMTMELWVSPDVPGYQELHSFHQRISSGPGWAAMMRGSGAGMQKSMAELQRKMASLNGVPVLQIMKMSAAGDAAQTAQMQQGMAQARAQLEALKAKGGEQAKMAEAALARMGGAGSPGGAMMEMTIESSGFSTATIPASEFAPPAGYQKTAVR